jgi:diguanylate cyclase (GGDEF)-like protein/PAS domain S-box-containing protein
MHRLLKRQLERYLHSDVPPGDWQALLEAISSYYREVDQEKSLLENALEVNSQELTSINERLRLQSAEMTHTMLDTLSEGVFATDVQGRFTFLNTAAEQMLGWKESEVAGRAVQDIIVFAQLDGEHVEDGEWQIAHVLTSGKLMAYEKCFICRDQRTLPVHFRIHPLWQDGKTVGTLVSFEDISQRRQHEELIWTQANFDTLTQLPNRRMFLDRLELEIKKFGRSERPLALLFIDLDHFKEVNDTLGHEIGDALLVEAALRITSSVRESDTVARLGGDEFTVILSQIADINQVEKITQIILSKLSTPFYLNNKSTYISASVGITFYPNDADNLEQLMKYADQAMYVAKNQGRNRYAFFTPALQEAAQARLRMINDLRTALQQQQFSICLQPIVHMTSGKIYKAESLIRWKHPERGMVPPSEFIPIAEESGLIDAIGDWVFYESVRWLPRCIEIAGKNFQISVNKSPVQFMREGDHSDWLSHLARLNLNGQNLAVEITEGLLLNPTSNITEKLFKFREASVQIAIDDFGTGYSSLSYLRKFNIDFLKIDQSFVREITTNLNDMALSEAIIVMAHKLNLQVIAEGVETAEQRDLLLAAGCDYAQGYYFARPMPPEAFEELLLNNHKHS